MAHTIELSDVQMASLARQIGTRMGFVPSGQGVTDEIAESFPVFVVDDRIGAAPGAAPKLLISAAALDTGSVHHNIARTTNPAPGSSAPASQSVVGAARSRFDPASNGYKVEAMTQAASGNDLPRWIRNAAYWVEQHASGDPFVKLLMVPSRYMHCFWLSYPDKDCVVVIDMPQKFSNLEYRKIYDSDEFFALLQREPPVSGLGS
jgi:hypothetical protein